ncbi:hypothetical protein ENHAE0001_2388 [Enhydrobacter aerosaccus SK60]|nr:hypothetical protein ENHAE0001_2388 [Enhydrobacter aerosaccus SK60]
MIINQNQKKAKWLIWLIWLSCLAIYSLIYSLRHPNILPLVYNP